MNYTLFLELFLCITAFFFAGLALEALINGQNTSRNQLCVGEELTLT